ncbi:uncharacterized protein LOC135835819 [Planococcus citri]|uniref:uncharacterized protein LOC135835819 n=1 Tax=Planococcus citri TaxID=170843 RepID=UPI0031F8FACB
MIDHSKSSTINIFRPSSSNRSPVSVFTSRPSSSSSVSFTYVDIALRIMYSSLSILFFVIFFCCVANSSAEAPDPEIVIESWAEQAYNWFIGQNCSQINNTVQETCTSMKLVKKMNYRIYGTTPVLGQKFAAVYPDGDSKNKTYFDGVLVLDPFPEARFGHPILVFYVNIFNRSAGCDETKGVLVDDQYCLQFWTRNQCNRTAPKRGIRYKAGAILGPNCGEIVFLPMVHLQSEPAIQANNKLRCFSNLKEFNRRCPDLRAHDRSIRVACHPLLNNDKNCGFYDNTFDGRCSTSQTCDHAVLLSGGWNRQFSDVSTWNNVQNVKNLLMSHGFLDNNIGIFFANGPKHSGRKHSPNRYNSDEDSDESEEIETERYFSSSLKDRLRNHIKILCDTEYCADTLLIYLNSPTRSDGSSLLWDYFDDGMYAEEELYTPKELFRDIYRCKANRVVILADQNYGNALVTAAEARFIHLQNVMIFTSYDDYNRNAEKSKDPLTEQLLREKYFDVCLNDFRNVFYKSHKSSQFIGYKMNLLNSTLVGAPCTAKATSLNDPEARKYRGCSLAPLV